MADIVQPAPRALLARRGEQLDGLGPLAAQKRATGRHRTPETPRRRWKPSRRRRSRRVRGPGTRGGRAGRARSSGSDAAGGEREQAGPARSATIEAVAEQRAAEAEALERAAQRGGSRSSSRSSLPSRSPVTVANSGGIDQRRRVRVGAELEPVRVADEPQHPRRVVDERAVVQHAQDAARRGRRGRRRHSDELVVGEPDGDRVDAEVAPRQVLLDRRAELRRPGSAPGRG